MVTGALVLAAGKGTRLRSSRAKVLHELAGRTLLAWVVEALLPLQLDRIVVVVGHQADEVSAAARRLGGGHVQTVLQDPQNGTGHAVRMAAEAGALDGLDDLLVLPGDVPAITSHTLARLRVHREGAAAAVLTTRLADATGYGRIVRDAEGDISAIVEDRDATPAQLAIDEVNTSLYAFRCADLLAVLPTLGTDNDQGEEYLTDTVAVLAATGQVRGCLGPADEVRGVNDQAQLAEVELLLRRRILDGHMASGVRILDPATTYVDATVRLAPDSTILPGTMLEGETDVAAGAVVGPHSRLRDTTVGPGATVTFSVTTKARIGAEATVGPYAHLRPGAVLQDRSKAGGFVEVKASTIGEGSKVPHLSYVGDAVIGRDVNLGAGTITVNYDGVDKHATTIGDGAFVGSATMLVAPIDVGAGAFVGAGSTITTDVPADALAVERAQVRVIPGWAARRRAGRAAAAGDGQRSPEQGSPDRGSGAIPDPSDPEQDTRR